MRASRPRRLPRPGVGFGLVRVAGWLSIGAGLLLLGVGLIGFVAMLVRAGPTLAGALQSLDQQMAGFVFLISLVNLLIFPAVGLVGAALAGIGLALGYIGTQPAASTAILGPVPAQMSRPEAPPTQRTS